MQWYVDSQTGRDANDGRSPKTAFRTMPQATLAAKPGDTVFIVPGAYDQDMPKQVAILRAAYVVVTVVGGH